MVTTKVKPQPTLQSSLEQLRAEEKQLEADIAKQKSIIRDWEDSLKILELDTDVAVTSVKVLEPLEVMKASQDKASSDLERRLKLAEYKVALQECRDNLKKLESSLRFKCQEICALEDNIYFEQNYLPFHEQFKTGFTVYSDEKNKRIKAVENDISEYTAKANLINRRLSGEKVYVVPPIGRTMEEYLTFTNKIIGDKEQELERVKGQELPNLLNDDDYRLWLQSRVNIDKPLQDLITAQNGYVSAMRKFKTKIDEDNSYCLDFKVFDLPNTLKVVSIVGDKITLSSTVLEGDTDE
jgi:chromosome segregation ATPase